MAASFPVSSAARSWSRFTVGSSPYQSSPTSASAIARRIRSEGFVTVSDRRSSGVVMGTWEYIGMRRSTLSFLLLSVMAQWGLAFVAIRVLVDHASAVTITLIRFLIAGAALAGVMALVSVITYHLALNFGEHYVSAGVASLIVAAAPVMTAVLSARVLHEHIPPAKALGIAAALAGVAVLVVGGADGDLRIENVGGALG